VTEVVLYRRIVAKVLAINVSNLLLNVTWAFLFQTKDVSVDSWWQMIEGCWIRHSKLHSFFQGSFNKFIMAEPLPLSIHRVYAAAWEIAKFDESLPVNLIFVLFAFELLSHMEDLD
jgi:hypothetical protein